ncbi:c-type cytochrome [Roseicella aquatilis]|uniref:Cytochrome c n=1 Tax=Roseicella aquatilis TaxID=2527868 RepID=A0A4R4D3N4_9PROT|nr:cytochrome c [Roseicella aquatilis]TCZ51934.1 cytochrome c [Roseicella aquatilis]
MRRAGAVAAALLLASGAMAQEGAGDPRAGRRLAGARCAVCHGNAGIAQQPDAPNLAGQNPAYLVTQLGHFRSGERRHEQMNLMARELSDAQIADLAAWYAAIEVEVTVPGR